MDMVAIAGALNSLKITKELVEAIIGLRDAQAIDVKRREIDAKLGDAQQIILTVQQELLAEMNKRHNLEKELMRFEGCEAEKKRYQLKETAPGSFAYAVKPSCQGEEPMHYLCATCYHRHKISVLQVIPHNSARATLGFSANVYRCSDCGCQATVLTR